MSNHPRLAPPQVHPGPPRHHTWLDDRFGLRLYQNSPGEWRLLTPSGLSLPASFALYSAPAEVSLWLDLQALRLQISSYETLITI